MFHILKGEKMQGMIELKNVKKTYIIGEQKFNALDGINLKINQGEFVVILRAFRSWKVNIIKYIRWYG